jgi:hypothetical protein
MRKIVLFSAVACIAFASAASALAANADSSAQPAAARARALDPEVGVKLPPKSLGPDEMKLENNEISEPQAGPGERAVIRSGCIFPYGNIRYRLYTGSSRVYTFRAVPTRRFDVVMRIDMPGVHRTVDRWYAGGTEALRVRTFVPRLPVTATIRGFGGSSGCFTFSATP